MTLPKLALDVPQDSYEIDDGDAVLRAQVSSGPSRQRLDMIDAPMMGSVQLILTATEYGYWRAFFRTSIARGALPFLMDLVIDTAEIAEYQVQIASPPKTSIQGTAHIVGFSIEVTPMADDPDYDASILMLYGLYGDQAASVLSTLAVLVNEDLPEAA